MEYIKNRQYIWLYAATYNNLWWCFNELNSKQLDMIYDDYAKRYNFENFDNVKNVNIIENKELNENLQIKNPSFNEVVFEDEINTDEKIEDKEIKTFDYIIQVKNMNFYIDLNNWIQINCVNNKRRKIKKLNIPANLTEAELVEFLKLSSVKGICGIMFAI